MNCPVVALAGEKCSDLTTVEFDWANKNSVNKNPVSQNPKLKKSFYSPSSSSPLLNVSRNLPVKWKFVFSVFKIKN